MRVAAVIVGCFAGLALTGCLSERSFPMRPDRVVRVAPAAVVETGGGRLPAREWAERVHAAAKRRLPADDQEALTTPDLAAGAKVVDVWSRLGIDPATVDSFWGNWRGIEETAQVASPPPAVESGHIQRAPWEGFHDVVVPVGPAGSAELFGRIGVPEKSREIPGSYVIITHGLFGSLDGLDMENQVQALRHAGHHVLALEMRGHGETNCRHPEYIISFGVQETGDLLSAARWLKEQGATRVGLVSFSITGYESLLAAWVDGTHAVGTPGDFPLMRDMLHNVGSWPAPGSPGGRMSGGGEPVSVRTAADRKNEPLFNGGMFIVSAPIGLVSLADSFEEARNVLDAPCKATFQGHVQARLKAYGDQPGHSMWDLARSEFRRSKYRAEYAGFEQMREDFLKLVDFHRGTQPWEAGVERMENVRVPVLVLSSANDPLGTAQNVADLFARVKNPNVGVIILKEGGHMGFSALSADYYYSLMLNFFDPGTAPGIAAERSVAAGAGR
jgi:predicted alpha/beta-fold hydrolase